MIYNRINIVSLLTYKTSENFTGFSKSDKCRNKMANHYSRFPGWFLTIFADKYYDAIILKSIKILNATFK